MNKPAVQFHEAFRNTNYQADTSLGGITIRVDQHTSLLDELLQQHAATEWAFITAHNPRSQQLSDAENRGRQAALVKQIEARRLTYFPGCGSAPDGKWSEESLLVIGISRSDALELARNFGQLAIVHGHLGKHAELVFVAG